MRKLNPSMVFVCDPVMGDQGKSYTPAGFNEIYRDRIIPFANVVTPNQTEAEKLSGIKIRTIEDAYKACQWFHDQGAHTVVITSLSCPSPASASSGADADATKPIFDATTPASEISTIDIIATTTAKHSVYPSSSPDAVTDAPDRYLHMSLPYFPTYFAGTGDLTTALLMAHLTKLSPAPGTAPPASSQLRQYPAILKEALQQTLCTVHAVIRSTLASNPEARELALVQAYRHILSPPSPAASLSSTEEVLGVSAESYGKPLFQLTEVFVNKNITE